LLRGMQENDYRGLFRLVEGAAVTVIEFAASWEFACRQFNLIRSHTRTRVRLRTALELEGNDLTSVR
jgi:hypothetical protein